MSTRNQQTIRLALLFSAIAAAVAFGWVAGPIFSYEKARVEVIVPRGTKEDGQKLTEEIQNLRKARLELAVSEYKDWLEGVPGLIDEDPMRKPAHTSIHERVTPLLQRFLLATLEYTDEPTLRHDLLTPLLNDAKKWEAIAECQVNMKTEGWSKGDLRRVQAARMEIQIEVLKAKRAEATGRYQ